MSKETVYHGIQDDVQSVHSLYEVTERDRKLKPGRKVLVGGLCTLGMFLECLRTGGNKDHPIDYEISTYQRRVLIDVRELIGDR